MAKPHLGFLGFLGGFTCFFGAYRGSSGLWGLVLRGFHGLRFKVKPVSDVEGLGFGGVVV